MKQEAIQAALGAIEEEFGVRVLYACESGSRAWGIESPDSDYDVRFIYVHEPRWYLQLHEPRDVIERATGDLDLSGWDVRKALRLAYKSNPALLEWLNSSIIYREEGVFAPRLRHLCQAFSAQALMHHYISLCERQVKAYWNGKRLENDESPVTLKKYLYAIRPIAAVYYMAVNEHRIPPLPFTAVAPYLGATVAEERELADLLKRKAKSGEKIGQGRYKALDGLIARGMEVGRDLACKAPRGNMNTSSLGGLLLTCLTDLAPRKFGRLRIELKLEAP